MSKANPQFTLALNLKKRFRVSTQENKGIRLSPKEAAFVGAQLEELSYLQNGEARLDFLTRIYREIYDGVRS